MLMTGYRRGGECGASSGLVGGKVHYWVRAMCGNGKGVKGLQKWKEQRTLAAFGHDQCVKNIRDEYVGLRWMFKQI